MTLPIRPIFPPTSRTGSMRRSPTAAAAKFVGRTKGRQLYTFKGQGRICSGCCYRHQSGQTSQVSGGNRNIGTIIGVDIAAVAGWFESIRHEFGLSGRDKTDVQQCI
jgi:hypothetical protein